MKECICSSCVNLKGIIDESGAIDLYECEHGFPADRCSECEDEKDCDATCIWYVNDEEVIQTVKLKCISCGKELEQICRNTEEGNIQCIDCFLKQDL